MTDVRQSRRSARPTKSATSDELRILRAEVAGLRAQCSEWAERVGELETQLAAAQDELTDSWEQIRRMRRSMSWRAARPVRAVQRWLAP